MQALPFGLALSVASQTAMFAYHSLRAIRDPTDGEAVSAVGELTSFEALEQMKRAMMSDIIGRRILKQQPLVTDDILERAQQLPEGTFGRQYATYMNVNGFTPSGRTPVNYIGDPTLAYIMTRYRQCHDYLHTCTDCGRTVEEELAVKLLEWHHTGLPLGLLAIVGGAPHLTRSQRQKMAIYWEWAKLNSPTAVHGERFVPFYLNVPWEDLLDKPMEEVLKVSGIIPLPRFLADRK